MKGFKKNEKWKGFRSGWNCMWDVKQGVYKFLTWPHPYAKN